VTIFVALLMFGVGLGVTAHALTIIMNVKAAVDASSSVLQGYTDYSQAKKAAIKQQLANMGAE
jgi:hypothetical protein